MKTIKYYLTIAIWKWKNRNWYNTRQKRKVLERVKRQARNKRF